MPTLTFTESEIGRINSEVSGKNGGLPWKLNAERCQVVTTDHTLIYSFSCDLGMGLSLQAQSSNTANLGGIYSLYGHALYGERVDEALRVLHNHFAEEAQQNPQNKDEGVDNE